MKLKQGELGTLKQNADALWKAMNEAIHTYGYSDITLTMEGAARALYEIVKLNNIED